MLHPKLRAVKIFLLFLWLSCGFIGKAQIKEQLIQLQQAVGLSSHQIMKLVQIDSLYVQEMQNTKQDAETRYNSPGNIQLQHKYRLLRRLRSYEAILTTEQYNKIKTLRFDIYEHKKWMAEFYNKNKLPSIEEAVAKEQKSKSN